MRIAAAIKPTEVTEQGGSPSLDEIRENLDDPMWRLSNLYQIIIKGDEKDDDSLVIRFKPNRAQRRLLSRLWHRNIILKARQLGFTTLICILWLDTALFAKAPIRCGIVAQDKDAAEAIFKDKVKFAYDHLPDMLRERFPLERDSSNELRFAHNGASIRVATSLRSGTIHRLHVSEFGKICAKYPEKAKEVVTGSIPAVPKSGVLVIESTAEGQDGHFYKMTQAAMAKAEKGDALTVKDYRLHFFAWWEAPEYELDPESVAFTPQINKYFHEVEAKIGRKLSMRKRAWYVATLESDFSGEQPLMWQEYPSYPEEAFQVSTEGCWYAEQMARVRKEGRIIRGLPALAIPVNTFWDVGRGDMTSIWLHQFATEQDRFLDYYENSGEDLIHYVMKLQEMAAERRVTFGTHYLPHECDHKRMGKTPDTNQSIKEMLEELWPGQRFEIVARITNLNAGIQQTREALGSALFDEERTAVGVKRVSNYSKRWNPTLGCWSDQEKQDDNCHGADAIRQWAQEKAAGNRFQNNAASRASTFKRRGSPMAR